MLFRLVEIDEVPTRIFKGLYGWGYMEGTYITLPIGLYMEREILGFLRTFGRHQR